MAALDVTQPEVLDHLASTAASLVELGYRYLKLDFTFSAAMPGRYADPTRTPAERVRAGFDAIRNGAGDEVFILGCGAPIGPTVGVVDAMRIGADVAPWWDAPPGRGEQLAGYDATTPSTHNAFVNTCTRAFMHRRLWANDPDCIMLRTVDTELSPAAAEGWARTVGCSGGLVIVSDDLALLGDQERRILDEVIALGRVADADAIAGSPARAGRLLDDAGPSGLNGAHSAIRLDPETGAARPA
jgi:alpha-galactosidase